MRPAAAHRTAEAPEDDRVPGPEDGRCPGSPTGTSGQDAGRIGAPGGEPAPARRPGRPRSEQAEHAIIEATLELFAERGPEGVCVEAVAARAGVGKATVYRRWHNKEELLLAALGSLKSPLPAPPGVSVREDLISLLTVMSEDAADPRRTRQYTLLLGEGEKYPRLLARYGQAVIEPRRNVIRSVLRRGIETGELRPDLDVEIAMLTLTGAAVARGKYETVPRTPDFAERIVDSLLAGFAPR